MAHSLDHGSFTNTAGVVLAQDDEDLVLDRYFAEHATEADQADLAIASQSWEIVFELEQLRRSRGKTQRGLALKAGLYQQAVSRLERTISPNTRLDTLQRYLHALGYSLQLVVTDQATGVPVGQLSFGEGAEQTPPPSKATPSSTVDSRWVDKAYEGKSAAEIAAAPVDTLQGISASDAEKLQQAFGIKTVADLANNKFIKLAQEIVKLTG